MVMGMREKLIELLRYVQYLGGLEEKIADHLIANGVTIPVRCKECKHNEDCIRRIQFWGRNPVLELNTSEYHPIDFCSYGERRTDV